MKPPLPPDEDARLDCLLGFGILDSAPEAEYDRVVQLAIRLFDVPMASVSLIDEKRQWLKARSGLNLVQTGRFNSFCTYTILSDEVMVIPDARLDPRFSTNPQVVGQPNICFYAGAPLVTPEGHRLGALCIMDVKPRRLSTDKIQALQQLAAVVVDALQLRQLVRENQRLASAVEESSTAIVALDPNRADSPITYANPAFLRLTGYQREELLGRSPRLLQGPETDPVSIRQIQEAIREHRAYEGRITFYHKDGGKVRTHLTTKPVFDRQGRLINYLGLQTDVTALERAEEQRRAEQARLERLSASAAGMAYQWVTYRDGTPRAFRYVSEGSRELFGVDPAAVAAEPDFLFYHLFEEDRPTFAQSIAQAASGLAPWRWQGRMLGSPDDHREIRVSAQATPTRLPGGDLLWDGVIVEASGQEPSPAENAADPADLLRDQSLNPDGRDLRVPLDAILEFGHLLQLDRASNAKAEAVQPLLDASGHLRELADKAADLVRLAGAAHGRVQKETLSLAELVRETLAIIRPSADAHGVSIREPDFAPGPGAPSVWRVRADRHQLQPVLLNLFSNAVKYNLPGGYLAVRCEPASTPDRVRIRVEDDGLGIPPHLRSRLFTPFDRLGVEAGAIPGVGLGLALSKLLTEAMGGSLFLLEAVEEANSPGAVFCVELPLASEETFQTPGADLGAQSARPLFSLPGRFTVLSIDGSWSNLQLEERLLGRAPQVQLLTASTASAGLEMACQHRPDLILLDAHLPDLPGDVVLAELNRHDATRTVPVVVVSADAAAPTIEKMLRAGAAACLTKPLDAHGFLSTVHDALFHAAGAGHTGEGVRRQSGQG